MTTSEKLARIMEFSVRINEETEFAAFTEFAGHVNLLHVRIAQEKELPNEVLATGNLFLGLGDKPKLDDCIDALSFILAHHAIPESLPLETEHGYHSSGLHKTKLSQVGRPNESTLINTPTTEYLEMRQIAKEVTA